MTAPVVVLAWLAADQAVSSVLATAADGRSWQEVLGQTAANVGAFITLLGAAWWLVGPRVREWVRKTAGRSAVTAVNHAEPAQEAAEHAATAAMTSLHLAELMARISEQLEDVAQELGGLTRMIAARVAQEGTQDE